MQWKNLAAITLSIASVMPQASAQKRVAPSPDCLDARAMREMLQAGPRLFVASDREGNRFRIDVAQECEGGRGSVTVLAPGGWVCGTGGEAVRTAQAQCPVSGLTRIDAREYARLARGKDDATGEDDTTPTLEATEVREARPRGFAGSPNYCFTPRYLRAWSESPDGLQVEVSPRHPGGHRFYRVELAGSCPDLFRAQEIAFHSAMDLGMICGNPGDTVRVVDAEARLFGARQRHPPPGSLACAIGAVYPIGDEGRRQGASD